MAKILLITVGTGKNREDVAGVIAYSIAHHNAAKNLLVVSRKTLQETVPLIRDKLRDKYPLEICELSDENNVFTIYNECLNWINNACEPRHADSGNVCIDYTTGTKAMSAGLVLAGISADVENISYVTGTRDEQGRVITGTEILTTVRSTLVLARRDLELAHRFFNQRQYAVSFSIAERVRGIVLTSEIQNSAALTICLSEAFQAWECFDHKKALECLTSLKRDDGMNTVLNTHRGWTAFIDRVSKHLHFCAEAIKEKKFDGSLLTDIFASGCRRLNDGRYDDAIARFYRTLEYFAQMRLATKHGVEDTGKIPVDRVPKPFADAHRGKLKNGYFKLGLTDSYSLLRAWGDDAGKMFIADFDSCKSEIRKMLEMRNNSILAHGLRPFKQENTNTFRQWLEHFIDANHPGFSNNLKELEFIQL